MFNEVRKCPTSDPETVSTLVDREGTAVFDEQSLLGFKSKESREFNGAMPSGPFRPFGLL